jgi:cell division protein FtsX
VNGYYLVEDGDKKSSENFDPARPMVVLDQRTGSAGVVTGTFTVVLEQGASADFLTKSSDVKVIASFPNTQTYFVTSSQVPFNLKAFKEALRDAPEVKDVQMEILDRQYEKF